MINYIIKKKLGIINELIAFLIIIRESKKKVIPSSFFFVPKQKIFSLLFTVDSSQLISIFSFNLSNHFFLDLRRFLYVLAKTSDCYEIVD